jgi:hypothetical protein
MDNISKHAICAIIVKISNNLIHFWLNVQKVDLSAFLQMDKPMLLLAEIGKKIASVVSEMSKYESLKTDDGHHTKPTAHMELHLNNTVYFCRYRNSAVLHFIITMACSTIIMTHIKKMSETDPSLHSLPQALGSRIVLFFNFINKMCIYNVYTRVWHASLWNKRLYELCPISLIMY